MLTRQGTPVTESPGLLLVAVAAVFTLAAYILILSPLLITTSWVCPLSEPPQLRRTRILGDIPGFMVMENVWFRNSTIGEASSSPRRSVAARHHSHQTFYPRIPLTSYPRRIESSAIPPDSLGLMLSFLTGRIQPLAAQRVRFCAAAL